MQSDGDSVSITCRSKYASEGITVEVEWFTGEDQTQIDDGVSGGDNSLNYLQRHFSLLTLSIKKFLYNYKITPTVYECRIHQQRNMGQCIDSNHV